MCDCIKSTEEHVKNGLSKANDSYKDKNITSVEMQNVILVFDAKQSVQLCTSAKLEYTETNKKGISREKKKSINLTYNYCPFCGVKYE